MLLVQTNPLHFQKISKHHHEPKIKKDKSKSKIEKFKSDSKKHKEKHAKHKLENSKEKMKSARSSEDTKTKIMMCPGCKKTFMSQSVLEEHMKTHDDLEIVSCAKCPFKALSQQQMQKHMLTHQQRIEQQSRPYPCPYCPARQADRSSFLLHQKTLHPGMKVFDNVMNAKVVLEDCRVRTKCWKSVFVIHNSDDEVWQEWRSAVPVFLNEERTWKIS